MEILKLSLAGLAMLVSGVLIWRIYPYCLSGFDLWRTSPVKFFFGRLSASIIGAYVIALAFAAFLDRSMPPESSTNATSSVKVDSQPRMAPKAGTVASAGTSNAPVVTSSNDAKGDMSREISSAPELSSAPTAQAPSDETARSVVLATREDTAYVKREREVIGSDVTVIDCGRPTLEFEKIVCGDSLLREQEKRIVASVRKKLAEEISSIDVRSRFFEFRNALSNCIYKICIENAYSDFEAKLVR